MYKKELLDKWNLTEDECEKAIKKITIKGMRLTQNEKEELFFYFKEGIIDENDIDSQIETINFGRELAQEMKEEKKLVRAFVKEWRRLKRKYNSFDYEDKSLDELTEMWINNYFELYFMEEYIELIKDTGAKEYAQYYCYNVGICPESEVSLWK